MNSQHLQDMVDGEIIPAWMEERLDRLPTEEQRTQAAEQLKGALEEALDKLCEKVQHPEGKVLFQAPAAPIAPPGGIVSAIRDAGHKKTALKWFAIMALAWFLWSPVLWILRSPLRGYHRMFTSEVRTEFRNIEAPQVAAPAPQQPEVVAPTAPQQHAAVPVSRHTGESRYPSITKAKPVDPGVRRGDAIASQNVSTNQHESTIDQTQTAKPTFLSAFAKNLLNNADGAVASAIPKASISQGVLAAKNAAIAASNEQRVASNESQGLIANNSSLGVVPIPTGLAWQPIGGGRLQVVWNSVGAGYRYNLYASPTDPVAFTYDHPENATPIAENNVLWVVPSDEGKNFLFEVKALDAQGRESAASNHIVVDLR